MQFELIENCFLAVGKQTRKSFFSEASDRRGFPRALWSIFWYFRMKSILIIVNLTIHMT